MFLHLNKKISLPNCSQVRCIDWSYDHDFIACGGTAGMLKVIRLDTNSNNQRPRNDSKNLSMNQTLESHKATVECCCWNEQFQKLTSSDTNGTIIVWMFYKGVWYEEMVNNRQKSLVTGMAWTKDGTKICIVYEDGAIITGSVDGSRLWGKEIKNISLNQVEWSPDGKIILIGTKDLEIHIFDYAGNFVGKLPLKSILDRRSETVNLMAIKWFKNEDHPCPLVIGFDNGRLQIMKNEMDTSATIVDCDLTFISSIEWNHTGDMLAVTGQGAGGRNFLKIFNPKGELLAMTRVPGNNNGIHDCSWDRSGFKLVLAVDSFIYFANLRCRIEHSCYLTDSVALVKQNYSLGLNRKSLIFWEFKSNESHEKQLANEMIAITSCHDYCVAIERLNSKIVHVNLYNSIGTLIDHHPTDFQATMCSMNSSRVILANVNGFYIWPFRQLYPNMAGMKGFIADDSSPQAATMHTVSDSDKISCLSASDKYLLIGFESGTIHQFMLPNANNCICRLETNGNARPIQMSLNKNSTKFALIDVQNRFHLYDFEANNEQTWTDGNWITDITDQFTDFVWNFKWSSDNNDLIVVMEKNRIILVNLHKSVTLLDPIISDGYVSSFRRLSIETMMLDQLIADMNRNGRQTINIDNYIETIECEYVSQMKALINDASSSSITDAINFAVKMPELPELWPILSDECLKLLDTETAYLAMIRNRDYRGLQFIKRLNRFKDPDLKRAEVCAYRNAFDDAESIYLDLDRPDLAVYLNKVSGSFERVKSLLEKYNNLANYDKEMDQTNRLLGDYYADNYDWPKAIRCFERINDYDRLAELYMNEEKLDSLLVLVDKVTNENLLLQIAMYLESYGHCKEAVGAYLKVNNPQMAIDACVKLNEWKMAIELADRFKMKNIDQLLHKYVEHLENDERYLDMIQIYRKANQIDKAIDVIERLIGQIQSAQTSVQCDAILLKKLYVLIGIIYAEHMENESNSSKTSGHKQQETLYELLLPQSYQQSSSQQQPVLLGIDPWKGAEAYHVYLLAHRNLYQGKYSPAMNAALHLQNYEEYLTSEQIYTLLAVTSYVNKCFDICSKAFIKLESLDAEQTAEQQSNSIEAILNGGANFRNNRNLPGTKSSIDNDDRRKRYQDIAVQIFLQNPLGTNYKHETTATMMKCKYCSQQTADYSIECGHCQAKFAPCVATGRSIIESQQSKWTCRRCKHAAIDEAIASFKNCPLCHALV